MAEYEKKVREVLKQHGFVFHHHGRGDHDVWFKASVNIKVTVDGKIKSRHMANQIMKEAGIDYHF
jgi:predicted RNA binding protein YcfA (HicA-like mRNA interferase family)